ncbi:MAG: prolyl oligopeptidase family serine peptidase [Gammaproteobacteria bacterium]
MASLAFHPAVFAAGISICGVSDIATLVAGTHKFESRYFDTLVGPLPEAAERYAARSPLGAIDRIRVPLLMIQGADDRIVSPDQAEGIVRGLRANGAPVAYLLFDGEGHGFRGAYALRRAIGAQLAFLGRVFGFSLTDPTFDLDIDNWTGHARCHDANTA